MIGNNREGFGEYYETVKKIKKDPAFETTTDHVFSKPQEKISYFYEKN